MSKKSSDAVQVSDTGPVLVVPSTPNDVYPDHTQRHPPVTLSQHMDLTFVVLIDDLRAFWPSTGRRMSL